MCRSTILSLKFFTRVSKEGTWVANWLAIFFNSSTARERVSVSVWAFSLASFSSASSFFRATRDLAAESLSPGSTPSATSYSMKAAAERIWSQSRASLMHDYIWTKLTRYLPTFSRLSSASWVSSSWFRARSTSFRALTRFNSSSKVCASVSLLRGPLWTCPSIDNAR
jgi:hypothetical protein